MKYEVYGEIKIADDFSVFDFVSFGKHGCILKRIEFMPTEMPSFYNLAFGDVNDDGEIDDYIISDNGDRNKVLATVAYTVEIYLNRYPDRWIYFKGSTEERTRLYRMAVGLNLEELLLKFEIYAEYGETIVSFQKNMDVLGLLVKKKV